MRKLITAVAVAAGLVAVAAPADAQVGDPVRERPAVERGMRGAMPMHRNPATAVLRHAEALELSAEQVRQLEAIEARVEQENAPRVERMREAFGERFMPENPRSMTREERLELRDQMRERFEALAPVRDQLRATNRAAGEEIHELLTAEQEAELRAIRRTQRDEIRQKMRDRRDAIRDGRRGPRGGRGEARWHRRGA